MSALPFISHHLFASAVRKDGAAEKPARKNDQFNQAARPLPEGLAKSMRGGPSARNT